jgi:hypothetical protein
MRIDLPMQNLDLLVESLQHHHGCASRGGVIHGGRVRLVQLLGTD